jgi:very-short-patch-repair endonuclease
VPNYGDLTPEELLARAARRKIAVEADSFEFHSSVAALARDCERYNELGVRGWTVYRFT